MGQAGGLMGWRMNADEQKHCSVASLHTSGRTCRDMNNRTKKKQKNKTPQIQALHRTGWVEIWWHRLQLSSHVDLYKINLAASDSSRCLKSLINVTETVRVKIRCIRCMFLWQKQQELLLTQFCGRCRLQILAIILIGSTSLLWELVIPTYPSLCWAASVSS